MTVIEIGLLVTLIGLFISVLTFTRNRDKDIKQAVSSDATERAIIRAKLDDISEGINSIRIDIRANERRVMELTERVIRVEESTKVAHKRLDVLENKGGCD